MVNNMDNARIRAGLTDRFGYHGIGVLKLNYGILQKDKSDQPVTQLLGNIIQMTQRTINASAASILLFRDNDYELFFEAVSGPVGRALQKVKLNTRYGIAGQVARTGKPLIVNDVSRSESFHKRIDDTTGFSTKSLICAPLSANSRILGVIEVLNKVDGTEFDEQDLEAVVSLAATAALAIDNTRQHQVISDAYKTTILALANAVDTRVPGTQGHSERVMEYALAAGKSIYIPDEELETIEYASILHDIGKIGIDTGIFNKAGELTPAEWDIIREHPIIGANILREIPFLENASILVLYHHERFDGKGYPEGIKGENIPFGARLIAVANAFDAMSTGRVYRPVDGVDYAISELKECSGTQFCPVAVNALINCFQINSEVRSASNPDTSN
jgi:HD-GYP domain-containing protein (c-di-GMP phosphodiesterase class II)